MASGWATIGVVGAHGLRSRWAQCVVVSLVLVGLNGCTFGTDPTTGPTPSLTSPTPSASAGSDAESVVAALGSLATQPEKLLSKNAAVTTKQARAAFPEGATVAADPATWKPDGTGVGGVIDVQVEAPGKKPKSFLAIMVKEDGAWRVLGTLPIGSSPLPEATR